MAITSAHDTVSLVVITSTTIKKKKKKWIYHLPLVKWQQHLPLAQYDINFNEGNNTSPKIK